MTIWNGALLSTCSVESLFVVCHEKMAYVDCGDILDSTNALLYQQAGSQGKASYSYSAKC